MDFTDGCTLKYYLILYDGDILVSDTSVMFVMYRVYENHPYFFSYLVKKLSIKLLLIVLNLWVTGSLRWTFLNKMPNIYTDV